MGEDDAGRCQRCRRFNHQENAAAGRTTSAGLRACGATRLTRTQRLCCARKLATRRWRTAQACCAPASKLVSERMLALSKQGRQGRHSGIRRVGCALLVFQCRVVGCASVSCIVSLPRLLWQTRAVSRGEHLLMFHDRRLLRRHAEHFCVRICFAGVALSVLICPHFVQHSMAHDDPTSSQTVKTIAPRWAVSQRSFARARAGASARDVSNRMWTSSDT